MRQSIPKWTWNLRYFLIITATFSVFTRVVIDIIEGPNPIHSFRYYSLQSNLMILSWTILAVRWRADDRYEKLTGFIKGGLTTYITITMVVYFLLLEPTSVKTGIDWWTSLCNHYLNPVLFIIDFGVAEIRQYQWRWALIWLIYPIVYLGFALVWGSIYNEYLYFFVNIQQLGVSGLLFWIGVLTMVFLGFGTLYIYINRRNLTDEE